MRQYPGAAAYLILKPLLLLLLPHLYQRRKALVPDLCVLERVERLHQQVQHAAVLARLEQVLDRLGELLVEVPREGRARVVGEDAHEHDGVVLVRGLEVVAPGEVLADEARALGGGGGGGLGGVDDGGEEEDFVAGLRSRLDGVLVSRGWKVLDVGIIVPCYRRSRTASIPGDALADHLDGSGNPIEAGSEAGARTTAVAAASSGLWFAGGGMFSADDEPKPGVRSCVRTSDNRQPPAHRGRRGERAA